VAEAEETVRDARAAYQKVMASEGALERLNATKGRLTEALATAEQAVQAHALAQAELANLPEVPQPHPVLPHVCEVMRVSVEAGECLVCGQGKPSAADLEMVQTNIAASQAANQQRAALESKVSGLRAAAERAIGVVQTLEREVESFGAGVPAEVTKWNPAELKADLDRLESQLLEYRAAADAWAKVKAAESAALTAETAAEQWAVLKSACEEAVAVVLDKALAAFVAKVQSHLPKGDTFDLRLRDGEREVVQFGLVRDGRLHTALSGAEWARVMAAMASATAGDGFAVLIPEERAFDPQTLTAVLRAFADVPQQVVLASPVAPAGRLPKGWTLVQTVRHGAAEESDAA
jgi:nitrate reductase cytochrome c-type subunit